MSIRYYSTNRNLKNVEGITPFTGKVSFKEALLKGQASDEGLVYAGYYSSTFFERYSEFERQTIQRYGIAGCQSVSWPMSFHWRFSKK